MTTKKPEFIHGNPKIHNLATRPDLAPAVATIRKSMAEADRTHAMGLAAIRQAAELTQIELAQKLGITQAAISRTEQPHDLLLSTLGAYLKAIGGHARIIVEFPNQPDIELTLPALQ